MRFLERFARGELRLSRIEALSDGVFAIILTLLVLELKVPVLADHHGTAELGRGLVNLLPKFLSWLISFIILCKFWLNHHHVLGLARHATYGLVWLNAFFLMSQAFIPFPSALMGEYAGNPLAVSAFGGAMATATLVFIALHAYVLRHLLRPELAAEQEPHIIRRSFIGVASYLVGAGAAWLHVYLGFAAYLITPLFFIVPPTRARAAGPTRE